MGAIAFCAVAREIGGGLTAEEVIREGDNALAAGRWAEAVMLYEQFLKDFGSAPEATPLLGRIRYAIARCYVSKGDFSSALTAIRNARETSSDSTESQPQGIEKNQNLLLWKGIAQLETGAAREAAATFADFLKSYPSAGRGGQRLVSELIVLRAIALIQAGSGREAVQWLDEQNKSAISDYYQVRMQLLKVVAFGEDDAAAVEALLQISPFTPFGRAKLQLLAVALAQSLLRKESPLLALRALSILLTRNEVLQNQQTMEALVEFKEEDVLWARRREQSLRQDRKEFERVQNWDDSILLLRATAFFDLQRYREAALALEALQNPGVDEFITALRCWLLAESPRNCLNVIQKFGKRFAPSPKLSLSRLLEGTAHLMLEDFEAALSSFRSIQSGEFVENARIQEIKALLMARKDEEALQVITVLVSLSPHSPFLEEVLYLRGVALNNKEEYDACRDAMSDLIRRFPKGDRMPGASFLKASAAHRKMDFPTAIIELREVLRKFPGSKDEAEILLLLGDALLDQRKIEEGIATYRKVPCSPLGLHEMAVFRLGKVLKKLGRLQELRSEMERFHREHPESMRLAEAIREIGYQAKPQVVRELYWKALEQQGVNVHASAIELLLQDLQKLYTAEGTRVDYQKRIVHIRKQALSDGKNILALRMAWAESRLIEDPLQKAQFIFACLTDDQMEHASSRLLSDFADSLETAKYYEQAETLYQNILKWHPSADERDRALAGLARVAQERGSKDESLRYWRQLLQQTPESRFVPEVHLAEALALMNVKEHQERASLEFHKVIRHDLASRAHKVEALYRLGELQMNNGQPGLAIPYFQRIYIAYWAEKKWVAQAYLRSATAFKMLGDDQSMQRTYQEMIEREDLKDLPEFHEAKEKLTQNKFESY